MNAHLELVWPGLIVLSAFLFAGFARPLAEELDRYARRKSAVWIDEVAREHKKHCPNGRDSQNGAREP